MHGELISQIKDKITHVIFTSRIKVLELHEVNLF